MGIFDRRPLALILCISLFGFVAFASGEVWIRVLAVSLIPLLFVFKAIIKSKSRVYAVSSLMLALSILCSVLYFDFWFYPESRFEGEDQITARIESIKDLENSNEIILYTEKINDAPLANYRLISYLDDDKAVKLSEGDRISFTGTVSDYKVREDFDSKAYYTSMGINGRVNIDGEIELIEAGEPPIVNAFPKMREYLRRRGVMQSDSMTGNLAGALLLGERDMLDEGLRLDFKIIGITHILALSGLHLSILVLGIGKLLELIGVGKKTRTVAIILFTLLYMAFTGFPSSVVRAGVMLIISSLLFLLSRSKDSVTSLVCAVFIIVAITPYSIYDISLWLSAFATLGVVMMGDYASSTNVKRRGLFIRGMRWLGLSLLASVFAVMATFAFSALIFGGYSLLSPISTLIFSPLTEIFMYLSTMMLISGNVIPIGSVASPIAHFIYSLANEMAGIDNVYLSTSFPVVYIGAILCTVTFITFLIVKIKRKRLAVYAIVAIYSIFLCVSYGVNLDHCATDKMDFATFNGTSDVLINCDSQRTVISSSSYEEDYAYNTLRNISSANYLYVDNYCFTHYSFNIPKNLEIVLSRVIVSTIYLPNPRNDTEELILQKIRNTAEKFDTSIVLYAEGGRIAFNTLTLHVIYSSEYGTETVRTAYTVDDGKARYTYFSSGMLDEDKYNECITLIKESDAVIFGSHGKKYKDKIYLDIFDLKTKVFILNSDNLFFTQESLAFYKRNGCEIFSHPSNVDLLTLSDVE